MPITASNTKKIHVQSSQIPKTTSSLIKTGNHSAFGSVIAIELRTGQATIGSSKSAEIQLTTSCECRQAGKSKGTKENIFVSFDYISYLEQKLKTLEKTSEYLRPNGRL